MKLRKIIISFTLLAFSWQLIAQKTFPVNGVADNREGLFAFTNATIYQSFNQKIENATLLIRNGRVEAIGKDVKLPNSIVKVDLKGKTIYPSFIDLFSDYGMPEAKSVGQSPQLQPQMLTNKSGAFAWNEAVKPEFRAAEVFKVDNNKSDGLRKLGFGAVLTHQMDGISRGSSAFVSLVGEREQVAMLKETAAHHLSFSKGKSTQAYPSSLMGSIALIRQTYYDAQWYKNGGNKEEQNLSLEAWNNLQSLPQIFDANDKLNIVRAAKIAKEFGTSYIIKGNGEEYQRLQEIKATAAPLIIPIVFPAAYDVEDSYDAFTVSLADMKHWELAPSNLAQLSKAGIEFAITANGLKNPDDFLKNLRKAVQVGLKEEDALKALTLTPAKLIKQELVLGTLDVGKIANFIITDGNIFDEKTKIYQNWTLGKINILETEKETTPLAIYDFNYGKKNTYLVMEGDEKSPKVFLVPDVNKKDSLKTEVKFTLKNGLASFSFAPDSTGTVQLFGSTTEKGFVGNGTLANGDWVAWSASKNEALKDKLTAKKEEKSDKKKPTTSVGDVVYPFLAYGWKEKPQAKTYLIKNVTIWTNETEGILNNSDVLIRDGKIAQVGKNLSAPDATVIDGTGKHFTNGIIDEHSHIAISRGVNEGTQESSAEVSISDVVNSEDINIYRQLAGGVTASQLLHGSANPIGGQSAIIKLKWGFAPEEMKIKDAPLFIKFALGENVKQSNWGDMNVIRFPQTRMGVEQVYDDYFTRAREYEKMKKSGKLVRKDLDLEVILQILNKERFITCHSYVQSEINMLMKMAEKHNFRINTFTHILEGYKVADKMAKHGVGASTFSDWWAYKMEVIDAIPQNAAIMMEQNIPTAINSDDAEMARRLNQEAAKSVMYGGMNEVDAWKMVTLNPAKLLHLDGKLGSIKVGKDADVVLWSHNPLSIYAKAEMTWIEGMKLFDRAEDEKMRLSIQSERARLLQKMAADKKGGAPTQMPKPKVQHLYHCDHTDDEGAE